MNRPILISTVGTSLFKGNLEPLVKGKKEDLPFNHEKISRYFKEKSFKQLASELRKLEGSDRICGAEINTINEILKLRDINPQNIIFLVSDTKDRENTGTVLKEYFSELKNSGIKNVDFKKIKGLQTEDPVKFQRKGLTNLVKEIGEIIQSYGSENIAVDATGGYKAQIAIAVVIGQALSIPVYYKHEFFNRIIDFPPMPVSLDYSLLGDNASLFHQLETNEILENAGTDLYDEKIDIFLEKTSVDNKEIIALSPIGHVYLTAFRILNPKRPENLIDSSNRKEPSFGKGHHLPSGFKKYINKIWQENSWISQIITLDYSGQKGLKNQGVFVSDKGNNHYELRGVYKGNDEFSGKFQIITETASKTDLTWAADRLNKKYF